MMSVLKHTGESSTKKNVLTYYGKFPGPIYHS